jgi:asparagine synthase (glutamine-hydrolysing)
VAALVFAGRFARGGRGGPERTTGLEAALRRDGPAASAEHEALAVAWTPPAHQPRPGGRTLCLIDGRPRLGRLAWKLGLDPDAPPEQIVIAGYERLGDELPGWLRGEFALLVWSGAEGRGLLVRDRLGIRPLFVSNAGPELLFASEIRNLLALLPRAPDSDPVAMAHWLARSSGAGERTLFAGIERVPAAHAVAFDRDGWRRWRYWRPSYAEPEPIAGADAAREVRSALTRAVERAVEGAESAGVLLSGGLDSAAVAAVSGAKLRAYSATFPDDPAVDESEAIARTREWLGMPGVEARYGSGSALAAGAEFIGEWEVPSVSPNVLVWLPLLRRAAADGVDVILDGEGGDELFGCAYYLVADRLRGGRPLAALRTARQLPGMGDRPRPRWLRRAIASYGVRAALPYGLHERLRRGRAERAAPDGWLAGETRRIQLDSDDPWAWKRTSGPRWWAHLSHLLTVAGDAMGAPDQLRRTALMAGLEQRHPLRDQALVDLVLRLPPELAFHRTLDRPLARRAMADALPPETLTQVDKPIFNSVLARAFGGPDAEALRRLIKDPDPELARRLRMEAVAAALKPPAPVHAPGPALDLWRIASLEMWLRHRSDPMAKPIATGTAGQTAISFVERSGLARQVGGPLPRSGSVPT